MRCPSRDGRLLRCRLLAKVGLYLASIEPSIPVPKPLTCLSQGKRELTTSHYTAAKHPLSRLARNFPAGNHVQAADIVQHCLKSSQNRHHFPDMKLLTGANEVKSDLDAIGQVAHLMCATCRYKNSLSLGLH